MQEFQPQNNRSTLELKCTIFPNAFAWLDRLITGLLTDNNAIKDLKDLKLLGEHGVLFLITEYNATTLTTTSHDYWFIRSINYDSSIFLYNNTPQKLDCTITFEKWIPKDPTVGK